MIEANSARGVFSSSNSVSRANKHNKKIHTKNTSGWIIFQSKIDVLIDTKAEATSVGEVFSLKLILLDLQATVEDLLSLLATNLTFYKDISIRQDITGKEGNFMIRTVT